MQIMDACPPLIASVGVQIPIEQGARLILAAGEQMAVAVVRDRDRRVAPNAEFRVIIGGFRETQARHEMFCLAWTAGTNRSVNAQRTVSPRRPGSRLST